MKHWCYYTRVVSYLERLEANQSQNTRTGAYLVWRDDDGPVMVAGPDIDWFRGDGPCPIGDLAAQTDLPAQAVTTEPQAEACGKRG